MFSHRTLKVVILPACPLLLFALIRLVIGCGRFPTHQIGISTIWGPRSGQVCLQQYDLDSNMLTN